MSKYGNYTKLYTVYDNRTDELIILDGNAREAAAAMGVTFSSFYTIVTRTRKGILKKWAIEVTKKPNN